MVQLSEDGAFVDLPKKGSVENEWSIAYVLDGKQYVDTLIMPSEDKGSKCCSSFTLGPEAIYRGQKVLSYGPLVGLPGVRIVLQRK